LENAGYRKKKKPQQKTEEERREESATRIIRIAGETAGKRFTATEHRDAKKLSSWKKNEKPATKGPSKNGSGPTQAKPPVKPFSQRDVGRMGTEKGGGVSVSVKGWRNYCRDLKQNCRKKRKGFAVEKNTRRKTSLWKEPVKRPGAKGKCKSGTSASVSL